MKKSYLNIILVIAFICIWGSIIRKYFGQKDVIKNLAELSTPTSKYSYEKDISKDTFQLKLLNFNPFKASLTERKQFVVNKKTYSKAVKKKVNENIVWPKISYHGFVKSQDKKTKLVIVKVNNRLYRKREKETIDELLVVRAYEDSLILSNNKELKTIKKINETL